MASAQPEADQRLFGKTLKQFGEKQNSCGLANFDSAVFFNSFFLMCVEISAINFKLRWLNSRHPQSPDNLFCQYTVRSVNQSLLKAAIQGPAAYGVPSLM